jgi:hypothetical protein
MKNKRTKHHVDNEKNTEANPVLTKKKVEQNPVVKMKKYRSEPCVLH